MWRRNCRGLVLVLLVLSLLTFMVSAQNISLEYPYNVSYGNPFEVNLTLINFSNDIYDIKINIINSNVSISEIQNNGGWQSSKNYISNSVDTNVTNSSGFLMNITEKYFGESKISVDIRNSNSTKSFASYIINVYEENTKKNWFNINVASKNELEKFAGIGPKTAQNIVDVRPFCSFDDLINVVGIGEITLKSMIEQDLAYVDPHEGCGYEDEKTEENNTIENATEKININNASKEKLEKINGIGSTTAENIIENKPFCSLDELIDIAGIGEITLKSIIEQDLAYVNPSENCSYKNNESNKTEKIEINTASKKELENIVNIGTVVAQRIVDYRNEHAFYSIEDLLNVTGIGESTLENIKKQGLAYVSEEYKKEKKENTQYTKYEEGKQEITEVIKLNQRKDIPKESGSVLYRSNGQFIKENVFLGFSILCLAIIGFLIFKKDIGGKI